MNSGHEIVAAGFALIGSGLLGVLLWKMGPEIALGYGALFMFLAALVALGLRDR